jgi:hypothetical protein
MLWIMSGALFLESNGICSNLSVSHKRLLDVDHMRYVWSWTIRGLSVGSVWRVGWVFPTGCTLIRITVTLEYD